VLSAGTAFGKTVIAIWMIAARKNNTLILVHRRQLLDQWRERRFKGYEAAGYSLVEEEFAFL
jgi:superfamily II DNA or RNA helicase